jgi:Xaa-Pro aminopeptidase
MDDLATAPETLSTHAGRLAALRAELRRRGLAGFLVPRADEHQGEYVPPRAERLAWLSGFTGSAGLAVVLENEAALFVDGRYTLQAREQVDTRLFVPVALGETPPERWIAGHLPAGSRLGYDPWLHTSDGVARLRQACAEAGAALVPCPDNPLDAVWMDQPGPPLAAALPHDLALAGEGSETKRRRLAEELARARLDGAVLTMPDSIAWLLNIRGADVPHTPVVLAFAILHADARVDLFVDSRKISPTAQAHLGPEIQIHSPAAFEEALRRLGAARKSIRIDPSTAAARIADLLEEAGASVARGPDPCALPKACKNPVELDGMRAAHLRDGAALSRFLAWIAREAPRGIIDEITAAERLTGFRAETGHLKDLSFDTISGAGPNGAIVHYRVTPESNRRLESGMLYLVDSGGQYPDGTTDVTRTVAIGTPPREARAHFTRVLKGHIALARCHFPAGTTGSQLDVLARLALWQAGLDFDHGTGHGVGHYLSVHEGPQRISKLPNMVGLRPGMILSNEPGYYREGAYGIRIENLVAVSAPAEIPGGERPMMAFETLTLAPIDLALVEPSLLDAEEIAWLNAYHARVRERIGPLVDADTRHWLAEATRPLERPLAA